MKKFILIVLVFLSSCSVTNYWPDDLYYSVPPQRQQGYIDLHDRYLRMKTRDSRWSQFDEDYFYWNGIRPNGFFIPSWQIQPAIPFSYQYYWRFNPYLYNGIWYNPSIYTRQIYNTPIYRNNYNPYTFSSPKSPKLEPRTRSFNLNTYNNQTRGYSNNTQPTTPVRRFESNTTPNTSVPRVNTPSVPRSTNAPVRKF
jgi:hypothetical protein